MVCSEFLRGSKMAKSDNIEVATTLLDTFTPDKVKELIELRPWMKTKRFILLTKKHEIEAYIDKCIEKGLCVYDLETNSLNTRTDENGECHAKIVGVCLSHDPDEGIYIPVAHEHAEDYNVPLNFVIRETKRLKANCVLIFHNFKYDGQILRSHGITFESEDEYEDTYLMAAVQDASRKEKNLKYLSGALLDRPQLEIDDLGIQGTKKNTVAFYLVPPQKAVYYGGGDGMNTMALYLYLKQKIDEMDPNRKDGPWAIYNVEKRCLFVTMEMERNLVKIDREYLENTTQDVDARMVKIIRDIYKISGHEFDINSTKQLGVVLFEELKIPYPSKLGKSKKGDYLTNSEVLEMVTTKNPIVNLILTYRGYVKIRSTYLQNWLINSDKNSEVKFQLNQIQADTGRYSGSGGKGLEIDGYCGVNCQNIPTYDKKNPHSINLRRAMVAHHGFKMVSIDYSGEELRIATNFSREPKWIQEFLHGTGDLHSITGRIITGKQDIDKKERSLGKCVAKGTLIATNRGWIPIEDIKVGDLVVTHTGELKKVLEVHHMGFKKGKEIESTIGYKITCGYNHQFLSVDDNWVRAEDLKLSDELRSVSCDKMNPSESYRLHFNFWDKGNNNFISENLPYIEINKLWARLLGYLLGDGHIHKHYAGIVCSPKDEDVKQDIIETCNKLGLPVNAVLRHRKGAKNPLWAINVGSTIFSRFCTHLGFSGRRGKIFRIPYFIFRSPKHVSKEFLRALFETDGTASGMLSVCTKDKELAQDIVLLLMSFGIKAYIYPKPSKKYKRDYYQVQISRLASDKFFKDIGFISKRKTEMLGEIVRRSRHKNAIKDQLWSTKIKNIRDIDNVELMDLTIEDDHTYVAQGFVTHNTVNFLTMYGGGAGGFAAQAKIPFETAKKMIITFFKEYSGLNKWIKREWAASRKRGYSRTAFGRRRPLEEFYNNPDKGIQSKGDRCAINSAIQGSAADILKIAMWRVYKWIRDNNFQDDVKILLPVHDEILYEVREDKMDMIVPELCRLMKIRDVTDKLKWQVPMEVDAEYGDSFHVDHDYWKEVEDRKREPSTVTAPEDNIPKLFDTSDKPETPETTEVIEKPEQIKEPEKKEEEKKTEKLLSSVGTTTQGSTNYYQDMVISDENFDEKGTREKIHQVLDGTENKMDQKLFKDTHIKNQIDEKGFFNFTIDIDLVSAIKIRFILETVKSGDNMFVGPKNKICLINKDGEVFYKSKEELSIDSFLALCIVFNI